MGTLNLVSLHHQINLPIFQRATLKNCEWPGNEAMSANDHARPITEGSEGQEGEDSTVNQSLF